MKKWFRKLFGLEFPKPSKTIMTLEEITRYWEELQEWQGQCRVFVYRIRKPSVENPKPSIWKDVPGIPDAEEILYMLGVPGEVNDPYTIRIYRQWEDQPGMKKKEEVCIANFELTIEA